MVKARTYPDKVKKPLKKEYFSCILESKGTEDVKAIPYKDCAQGAQSGVLSDKAKTAGNTVCISEDFSKVWRKRCKRIAYKGVSRSLCGIALDAAFAAKGQEEEKNAGNQGYFDR